MFSLGNPSKSTILIVEIEKLALEFVTDSVLKKAQPVKLVAGTGNITAWVPTDGMQTLLGYCYSDAAIGDNVTVFTRGYMLIFGLSGAAINAGNAKWSAYDAATAAPAGSDYTGAIGYHKYVQATDANNTIPT
jgi:hypothetical protein